MPLWYDIKINGEYEYQDLQTGMFLIEHDELHIFLEGGTETVRLEKGDHIEVLIK